ncbi:DUF6882 domain-containing protein [Streptomyces sp. NPDC051098]|uniref:DUF6882 domain-containing protein n=1 Tax=Streptomyces sp. NPDC051098 TaxID=3155411 RepID=UPI0034422178
MDTHGLWRPHSRGYGPLRQQHLRCGELVTLGAATSGQDERAGVITWAFPEKPARAPAQILAGSSPLSSSWLWAWANESVLRAMSRDARPVRDWAEAHGHHAPAQLPLPALVRVRARADSCRRERQWHA